MTQDEIIEMARENGIAAFNGVHIVFELSQLEAFAKLVADVATAKAAEREREACAKVCEDFSKTHGLHTKHCVAAAIRARGITQV